MISDPYRILGVQPGTTDEEITKAYRRLAKKYHPDVNRNNPDAAKKMSEINAAYDLIKEGKGSSYRTAEKDGPAGNRYDPFGGFGPFGSYGPFRYNNPYGSANSSGNYDPFGRNSGQNTASVFNPVKNYLKAGYYREALNVLAGIADKTAEWYYYSAIANLGAGNRITALNHARTAVQMEPGNSDYVSLLDMMQGGARVYQKERQGFGIPVYDLNKVCIGLCLARICCLFCWR